MIAIFTAWLDRQPARPDLLDAGERARAARLHRAVDRDRFVARRALLRTLLADELARPPHDIAYTFGDHGKPAIAGEPALRFGTSQSHGLWLCAVARDIEIGCDVERIDPALADPDVAERLFAPGERDRLAGLAPTDYPRGFFECWSRKEAFVKAIGKGLSWPLDAFEVTCGPGVAARLVSGGDGWALRDLALAPGWCGALVAPADAIGAVAPPRLLTL